jgi:hypothetical protein
MWSDNLLIAERAHLVRLIAWGAGSMLVGTALLPLLRLRRTRSPLLFHFALQTIAWGGVDLVLAWTGWQNLEMRDIAGATRLDRFIWFNAGLDLGYAGVGATMIILGWRLGRRLGLVGAGVGIVVQGLALATLDLQLTMIVARLV